MSIDPMGFASMSLASMRMDLAPFAAVHFLRPQWLLALLGLPLLAGLWRARARRHSAWRDAVDPHLLAHLLDTGNDARGRGAWWLGMLSVVLAIVALAGPSWERRAQPLWQSHAPLVIALDLSTATLAGDLPPSRLLQARAKIATLLQSRAGGQVGLVAYADDAYTVAPLTDDAGNVALFLDALSPDVMPVDGSHADRAVAWSARLLRQAGFNHGDILLLTDHADTAARGAAKTAAGDGFRVSALGLGRPGGAAYRDTDGHIAEARLDAASLRAFAAAGGGAYATLVPGTGDLDALGVLDPGQAGIAAAHGEKTATWLDQGYWLLPPLMLLALFALRRGGALAIVLLCCCLPWRPAVAAPGDWWLRADQHAHARLEQGVDAYRKQDFASAARQWQGVPGADAAYNRGNALAKSGDYDAAIAAYDQALQLQPGMADAIANRQAVEQAKKRKPPPGKKPGNPQSGGQGSSGSPKQSADGQQQSQQQSRQGSQQKPASNGQQAPDKPGDRKGDAAQPDKPADAKAQHAADAAQRARMQRALQQAHAQGKTVETRAETPAQRERRMANDAVLRRVPDDPGGLLRAKFQLEYERRAQEGE